MSQLSLHFGTELIISVILFFSIAFFTACFSTFIQFCIEKPGRIFFRYKLWLCLAALRKRAPELLSQIETDFRNLESPENIVDVSQMSDMTRKRNFYNNIVANAEPILYWEKPLGLCVICFNVWLCFGSFWLTGIQYYFASDWRLWFAPLAFTVLSNYYVRKMNK